MPIRSGCKKPVAFDVAKLNNLLLLQLCRIYSYFHIDIHSLCFQNLSRKNFDAEKKQKWSMQLTEFQQFARKRNWPICFPPNCKIRLNLILWESLKKYSNACKNGDAPGRRHEMLLCRCPFSISRPIPSTLTRSYREHDSFRVKSGPMFHVRY